MQESRAISGSQMLKTLIIATVLLPTLTFAQRSQQLPQPRADKAPAAIPKTVGARPAGARAAVIAPAEVRIDETDN